MLPALGPAQMLAYCTLRGEAWIPLIGPGNMQVSGSKGRQQVTVRGKTEPKSLLNSWMSSGLSWRLCGEEIVFRA